MFRMLIHPSSGACDYLVHYCVGCIVLTWGVLVLCSGIGCWWCGIWVQAEPQVVVQPALGVLVGDVVSECRLNHYCWCYVAGLAVGDVVSECRLNHYCWCYVEGLAVGDVVSECRLNHYLWFCLHSECLLVMWYPSVGRTTTCGSACTQIPHHQQPLPLHNTNTPQVSTIQPTQ